MIFDPLGEEDEGIPCAPCGLKITRSVNDYGWHVITVVYEDGYVVILHAETDLEDAFITQAADQRKELKLSSYTPDELVKRGYTPDRHCPQSGGNS